MTHEFTDVLNGWGLYEKGEHTAGFKCWGTLMKCVGPCVHYIFRPEDTRYSIVEVENPNDIQSPARDE